MRHSNCGRCGGVIGATNMHHLVPKRHCSCPPPVHIPIPVPQPWIIPVRPQPIIQPWCHGFGCQCPSCRPVRFWC